MPSLSLEALAAAAGGEVARGDPSLVVSTYSIDTRSMKPGAVFFALPGANADGHAFLDAAATAGAQAAVVREVPPPDRPAPRALIRVDDPVAALGRCGAAARRARPLRVVGVTGSTGKTTTKELIASGLSASFRVHRSRGNLNNHLGVPLSLLETPDDAEIAVIEMGMSAPGEIAALMRISDPDVALVTNVRPVHLEFLGSLDAIAAAKGEMYALLRADGISVVNLDDEACRVQATRHAGPRVTFGRDPGSDLALESIEDRFVPGAALVFRRNDHTRELRLSLPGAHSARNALAALAAVVAADGDLDAALGPMAALSSPSGRGEIHRLAGGVLLVDDSYNSSPAALSSVLDTLRASSPEGRKVLVMGDMLELGPDEIAFHRRAGQKAAGAGVELLVGVGPRSRAAVDAARSAKVPEVRHEADSAAAARAVPGLIRPGDLVVVKGSRGVRLERVVEALRQSLGGEV